MAERVEIASDALSAAIDPLGAELTHLRDAAGRELMTNADSAFWTGHAPILFPIVGEAAGGVIRVNGTAYPIARHGFARRSRFEVVERAASRAVFRLTDDAGTRAAWPFAFVLDIAFEIAGTTLSVTARIGNPAGTPLWASFGFHPAFAWPLPYGQPRVDHRIVFDADEGDLRQLDEAGLIVPEHRASPLEACPERLPQAGSRRGRTLNLRDALFADDALIWDRLNSQGVTYGAADGPQLRVEFPDTPMLGIWTKPGSAFVCIEPWHGIADAEGFAGEFRDKPGVFEVAPGAAKQIEMRVTLQA